MQRIAGENLIDKILCEILKITQIHQYFPPQNFVPMGNKFCSAFEYTFCYYTYIATCHTIPLGDLQGMHLQQKATILT